MNFVIFSSILGCLYLPCNQVILNEKALPGSISVEEEMAIVLVLDIIYLVHFIFIAMAIEMQSFLDF